jgi:hypothetical protein
VARAFGALRWRATGAMQRDIFTPVLHLLWAGHNRHEQTTGTMMTNDGEHMGRDNSDNVATYASFMAMTKWGVILVVLVLLLMWVFLV